MPERVVERMEPRNSEDIQRYNGIFVENLFARLHELKGDSDEALETITENFPTIINVGLQTGQLEVLLKVLSGYLPENRISMGYNSRDFVFKALEGFKVIKKI